MDGDLKKRLAAAFKHYVEVSSVGQQLTEPAKKEIRDKGMNKMLKESCGDAVAKASEAQVFPRLCDKRTKKMHLTVFLGEFIPELAATVIQNKKKLSKRPDTADPEVVTLTDELRQMIAEKADAKPKEMKVDAVTARLTDTKGYTGTHKERFDQGGKGKGLAGRKDLYDQAGYVTGYKHQGTYGDGSEDGAGV